MLDIEFARLTARELFFRLDEFEQCCTGKKQCSPAQFQDMNRDLSIGAVLTLGKHRYQKTADGVRLLWTGADNREHDLGLIHDMHVMRDYPGFHAQRSRSLRNHMVSGSKTVDAPHKKGSMCVVTMQDGSAGIGPNYRIALRNAALKMHLTAQFNRFSLAHIWKQVWGRA